MAAIPTRNEMVEMLWSQAQLSDASANDKAKLCRVIAHLMGYNRGEDYSDLEAQLKQIEAQAAARLASEPDPEPDWYQ